MGEYVRVGDVSEWRWDKGEEPVVKVPKGEFDPREPKVQPKAEPEAEEPKKAAKK